MATIKTAISIDTRIYRKIDRISRRLRISRSQFFSQAAQHMIDRDETLELVRKINEAWDDSEGEKRRSREKAYTRRRVIDTW